MIQRCAVLSYLPKGSGSFGIKGKDRNIKSLGGLKFYAEGVPRNGKKLLEWGGFFVYESDNYLLDRLKASSSATTSSTTTATTPAKNSLAIGGWGLGILGRYRF